MTVWLPVRIGLYSLNNAGWSSQVARQSHKLKVVGSNPAPAIYFPRKGDHGTLDEGLGCLLP